LDHLEGFTDAEIVANNTVIQTYQEAFEEEKSYENNYIHRYLLSLAALG
jgi:hypothetical protein